MMRRAVLCLGLLLAACGGPSGPLTDEQACARQANDDPAVRDLLMKGAGSETFALENQRRLSAARQDATVACLRARGVIRPGGVERQRPL